MKLNHTYRYILALMLLLFSCQKNELAPTETITDAITFSVSSTGGSNNYNASTKAAVDSLILLSDDGTDSLVLYISVTDNINNENTLFKEDTISTKGFAVTDNNLKEKCENKIALKAFYLNEQFVDDVLVFDNDGSTRTSKASYWPTAQGAQVDFWSFHPHNLPGAGNITIINNENEPSLSFHYSQKDGNNEKLVDVTDQTDLFLAYSRQGKENGSVPLSYSHALSAVRFYAGKALAGEIKSIEISNVYASGTLTYSPKANEKIYWTSVDETCTLSKNFNLEIKEDITGNSPQAITEDINNTVFMLIPQDLTNKQLTIKYLKKGATVTRTYTVNMPAGEWKAGKAYTYTLSLMDGFGFNIETDSPSGGKIINAIKIKNTNGTPCYIRAMIIGNWIDEAGNIAAILNPDEINLKIAATNTNYQLDANWETYWYYEENTNIYYYKKHLSQNQYTAVDLFNKFTNPVQNEEGLKLDFTVIVQAVEAENTKESVKTAWGETIANMLEPLQQ